MLLMMIIDKKGVKRSWKAEYGKSMRLVWLFSRMCVVKRDSFWSHQYIPPCIIICHLGMALKKIESLYRKVILEHVYSVMQ